MRLKTRWFVALGLILTSCGQGPTSSQLEEAWDDINSPALMKWIHDTFDYQLSFKLLPTSAALEQVPWTDDYWPTHNGGLTYRWMQEGAEQKRYSYDLLDMAKVKSSYSLEELKKLSPIEKFDIFLDHPKFLLTELERERTNVMKTVKGSPKYDSKFKIPKWEGLCHSWAPASILFKEPKPVVVKNAKGLNVPFGSSDVKALLTYFMNFDETFDSVGLGDRCEFDFSKMRKKLRGGKITATDYRKALDSAACRDVNAGAFHVVLTNQIGLMKQPFIIDRARDMEVWNQPVFSFTTNIVSETAGASPKAAPGTVKEIVVDTLVKYIVEVEPRWEAGPVPESIAEERYRYRLELDDKDQIIGGHWLTYARPDFLWKQTKSEFSGIFLPLKEIYEASIK